MMWMPEKARDCSGSSGAKAPGFLTFFGTAKALPSLGDSGSLPIGLGTRAPRRALVASLGMT